MRTHAITCRRTLWLAVLLLLLMVSSLLPLLLLRIRRTATIQTINRHRKPWVRSSLRHSILMYALVLLLVLLAGAWVLIPISHLRWRRWW